MPEPDRRDDHTRSSGPPALSTPNRALVHLESRVSGIGAERSSALHVALTSRSTSQQECLPSTPVSRLSERSGALRSTLHSRPARLRIKSAALERRPPACPRLLS